MKESLIIYESENDKMLKNKYPVALMGSRPLSMKILKYLVERDFIDIKAVVPSKIDNPYWRGSLEEVANSFNIGILKAEDLIKIPLDVIFSVNYFKLIKDPLLSHPRIGIVNIHHSHNLKYIGRNSCTFAILDARKEDCWKHGTTLHLIDENLDRGKIIDTKSCPIYEQDTAKSLFMRVEKLAFKLFKKNLLPILEERIKTTLPDPNPKYHDSYSMDNKEVNLEWSPKKIYDFVRAYTFPPFEGSYIKIGDKRFYLKSGIKK